MNHDRRRAKVPTQAASINHRPAFCLPCGKWSAVMADGYALTPDGVRPVGRVARCAECGTSTIVEVTP